MAVSLAGFYSRRKSLPRLSGPDIYRPNESLTDRRDLNVSMSVSDLEEDFELEPNFAGPSTSTPEHSSRRMPLQTTPRSRMNPESARSGQVLSMLQEQQCILKKLLSDQEEITKLVKNNDKRIASIEADVKKYAADSSSSSSCEKKRLVTKDLTVSYPQV